jgi:hypothetical protein
MMEDVGLLAGEAIVHTDDEISLIFHQPIDEVRPEMEKIGVANTASPLLHNASLTPLHTPLSPSYVYYLDGGRGLGGVGIGGVTGGGPAGRAIAFALVASPVVVRRKWNDAEEGLRQRTERGENGRGLERRRTQSVTATS